MWEMDLTTTSTGKWQAAVVVAVDHYSTGGIGFQTPQHLRL
jgi:hypothetical protein